MSIIDNCPMIITSCDRYSDAWHPFFTLLFRYWDDCPFPIYLISNTKSYPDERVKTILCDPDERWNRNLLTTLKQIGSTESFLYMQEDFFMKRKVDTEKIIDIHDYFIKEKIDLIRLRWCPIRPNNPWSDPRFYFVPHGQKSRMGLQAGFWKRTTFEYLLKSGKTASVIESRSHTDPDIVSKKWVVLTTMDLETLPYFRTAISKGKWIPDALELCKKEGIVVDTSKRRIKTRMSAYSKKYNR